MTAYPKLIILAISKMLGCHPVSLSELWCGVFLRLYGSMSSNSKYHIRNSHGRCEHHSFGNSIGHLDGANANETVKVL